MKEKLLNVVLAVTEELQPSFKGAIDDCTDQFKKNQGLFQGVHNSYEQYPDTDDFPQLRVSTKTASTVKEKLDYLESTTTKYIDNVLSLEKTNSSNVASAHLIVNGEDWGLMSSCELLRLKNILQNSKLAELYKNIPVRSDKVSWKRTILEEYATREIWETEKLTSEKKTSENESYVLSPANEFCNQPTIAQRKVTIPLGRQSTQNFSGEWSPTQRANVLKRLNDLLVAIKEALVVANSVPAIESELTAEKLFRYLHG